MANPNDPFAQSWQDIACDDAFKHAAQNMHVSKKLTAHSYISSKCNVSRVIAQMDADQTADFEGYVLKAASAAYKKVFPELDVNMARVEADGIRFY